MAEWTSILEVHAKCWDYLISIQKSDPNFFFVPRKINKLNRLEQGYFFIGNDTYMQISFWDGSDTYEKIHNISWGVNNKGICFIELSSKDNPDRAVYLAELINILEEKTGITFQDLNKGKWRYDYPDNTFYLDSLHSFTQREKIIIDEYIKVHPESGISMLDSNFNEQYVLKLLNKASNNPQKNKSTKKQEGSVSVSPSSYLMSLHHNELQNVMADYLKAQDNVSIVYTEVNNVDISVKTITGERIFYELKTSDAKQAMRLAIGQLLEYCHYNDKTGADKLIIITKYPPTANDITYIQKLRKLYNLPIYYQQFDMEQKVLLEIY